MRKMLLIFCLIVLICLPVAANPVVISGIGEVELGQGIVVTEDRDKKGEISYNFRVKDGEVWRGATLLPISNLSSDGADMIRTDVLLNRIVLEELSKDNDVLSTEKARQVTIGGRECATTTVKFAIPGGGFVANMDMTIISGTNGLKMFGYICADGDTQYWRPIMQMILARIP